MAHSRSRSNSTKVGGKNVGAPAMSKKRHREDPEEDDHDRPLPGFGPIVTDEEYNRLQSVEISAKGKKNVGAPAMGKKQHREDTEEKDDDLPSPPFAPPPASINVHTQPVSDLLPKPYSRTSVWDLALRPTAAGTLE